MPNTPSPTGHPPSRNVARRPCQLPPSPPTSVLAHAQPTKSTQPTGSTTPPEGEPLWHRRPTRGPAGVGYPPRDQGANHPRAGRAKGTIGPEIPPCRHRAPALALRACPHPVGPTASPAPPRESVRLPAPVRLAQSCLSTYPPTSLCSKTVNPSRKWTQKQKRRPFSMGLVRARVALHS